MKTCKFIVVTAFCSLFFFSCQESQDITTFKDSEQKIVSKFFDNNIKKEIFLTTTPNKNVYSISIYKDQELVPVVYYSEKENGDYLLFDINGIIIAEGNVEKTIKDINNEGDKDDITSSIPVKVSFTKSSDCIGGSTKGCYKYVREACINDDDCHNMCRAAGWRCEAAIAVACFIHCNT